MLLFLFVYCLLCTVYWLLRYKELESSDIFQCNTGSTHHCTKRIFSNVDGKFGLDRDTLIEAAQQGTAAGEIDSGTVDICGKLRWRELQCFQNSFFNF